MTPEPLSMPALIEIRNRLDRGASVSWVARYYGLSYHRVWRINARVSFADVPWPARDAQELDQLGGDAA